MKVKIKIKLFDKSAIFPKYQTAGSSGFDLHCLETTEIAPNKSLLIRTGVGFQIPENYEIQLRPRSSTMLKYNLISSFGTIDSDYRGEVKGILYNPNPDYVFIYKGERIMQAILCPIAKADMQIVSNLDPSLRGEKGFGSTGV